MRNSKPFNPLLGETWEYKHDDFKIITEQVSHHPPISAIYAESPNFQYQCNSNVKTIFWGKSIEIQPLGIKKLLLKKHNDIIEFN